MDVQTPSTAHRASLHTVNQANLDLPNDHSGPTKGLLEVTIWGVRVRFGLGLGLLVKDRFSLRVNSFSDFFSVLLHAQHHSMLTVNRSVQ